MLDSSVALLAAADTTPLGRLVDYGGLGIFLFVALYAIKTLWGRDDKRNEQRDKQLQESLGLYQGALKKIDDLQELRAKETREHAEALKTTIQEVNRLLHQHTTAWDKVTGALQEQDQKLDEIRLRLGRHEYQEDSTGKR